ncbi:hypothetical protein BIV24_21930 [Streptomyces colonosanans]|uniref:Uncharacterized protein n=1 Tax=Streptomyces colonosanans TaxID=1428652 RepID=A0A1S2P340_9ACTN|nr:hypothetical protein BIV24_21930 [Streptomyces colonosanans]
MVHDLKLDSFLRGVERERQRRLVRGDALEVSGEVRLTGEAVPESDLAREPRALLERDLHGQMRNTLDHVSPPFPFVRLVASATTECASSAFSTSLM